jgi:hypothetical protein
VRNAPVGVAHERAGAGARAEVSFVQ